MGSSARKKKEKSKDFQKTKLKVGKARPKNTNATDTSFSAKSIVLKQQNLNENGSEFLRQLSLLSSRNETQRRDSLKYLMKELKSAAPRFDLPQTPAFILTKAQGLISDGNREVRGQFLELCRLLPADQLGPVDQLLLYVRAGMAHLSNDICMSALDVLDWLSATAPTALLGCPGGWMVTLRTFQDQLTQKSSSLEKKKLLIHQLTSLARFLVAALERPPYDPAIDAEVAAQLFPLQQTNMHRLVAKSNAFDHLNLFGAQRNVEWEVYDDSQERAQVLVESGLREAFEIEMKKAKKEGGEMGRAAASLDKALRLAEVMV